MEARCDSAGDYASEKGVGGVSIGRLFLLPVVDALAVFGRCWLYGAGVCVGFHLHSVAAVLAAVACLSIWVTTEVLA